MSNVICASRDENAEPCAQCEHGKPHEASGRCRIPCRRAPGESGYRIQNTVCLPVAERSDLHTPGAKDDKQKIQADLLLDFRRALTAVAEVSTFGAQKYTRGGWLTVPDGQCRYTAALIRHLLAADDKDKESGLRHAAHTAWNALAVLELKLREEGRE